jgi:PBP1b-binding outer membrane lipoprotein LpoB
MKIVSSFIFIVLLLGCSNHEVNRLDLKDIQLTTIRWGANDLQEMSDEMVSSLLSSHIDLPKNKVYAFGKIRNVTYDHIDTKLLANKTMVGLSQSGKFGFSENLQSETLKLEKEQLSLAKGYGVDRIFYGKISSIFKKNKEGKDMYFEFELWLTDVENRKILWSNVFEIRKEYKKELIGW